MLLNRRRLKQEWSTPGGVRRGWTAKKKQNKVATVTVISERFVKFL